MWFRCLANKFKFKNCLLGATSIAKNSEKEKYVYSDYGIIFDSVCAWRFDNDTARNIVIFGVDNSSSSYVDNHKNIFLVLGEGPTFGIVRSFVQQRKSLIIILVKQTQKFARVCIRMLLVVIFFVNGK